MITKKYFFILTLEKPLNGLSKVKTVNGVIAFTKKCSEEQKFNEILKEVIKENDFYKESNVIFYYIKLNGE